MNHLNLSRCALSVCVAAIMLAACGGSQGTSLTMPVSGLAPRGIAPNSWPLLRIGGVPPRRHHRYQGLRDLYVTDAANNAVELLANGTYKNVGSISSGISGPSADFLDKKGNLYVVNVSAGSNGNIREYAPGGTSPSFTYTAGMVDPAGVSVDAAGNVYEADYFGGFVNEYAQGVNAVLNSCTVANPVGVAVGATGDVFVTTTGSGGPNTITEYFGLAKRGQPPRCQFTTLGAKLYSGGGMVLDNSNDLVVCDQLAPAVDIIAPPYSSITRTLGGPYADPYQVTLSKDNALAFVTDLVAHVVLVYDYKTNTLVTTLGSGNGLSAPIGAVDGPNDVH